jgi:catechol 2,3-dioxygenase-like lactoylglutathione lyase family enzyme
MGPRVTGTHHVKVPVSDLARSAEWYERVLGVERRLEFTDDDGTVRGIAYQPLGDFSLALREDPERARALAGFDPFAALVPTRADLEDLVAHLDRLGVGHGPIVTATIGWLLAVPDPDGIEVRFYTAERHEPSDGAGAGRFTEERRPGG